MDERVQLDQAREQLRNSAATAWNDLKNYGRAVVDHNNAVVEQRKEQREFARLEREREAEIKARTEEHRKGMEAAFKEQERIERQQEREFARLEREREAEIKARTAEHKKGMEAAFKEQERIERQQERQARRLQFKEGVKQKANSILAKLGKIKNELLRKLSPNNIDMKLRNAYEQAQIAGLSVANKGVQALNTAKEGIADFTTTQVERYHNWQAEREFARLEREREAEIKARTEEHRKGMEAAFKEQERIERQQEREFARLEREREAEIKARTAEHKKGMEAAFKEQERIERQQERQARRLQFKEDVKQKANSTLAKLGKIKNELLRKLSPSNIDMKLRNAYEQAQIAGLSVANKGVQALNTAKEGIADFATTQVERYHNWQAERENARLEREREARTEEHRKGMEAAFRKQERQARILQFKEGVKQKADSALAKLGKVKNIALDKLNSVKGNVEQFTNEQIAKYYNWQAEREERKSEKEFQEAAKRAEKEELERIKARTRERKKDMIAALNSQEREMYEQRHLDNQARKEELLASLSGETDRLFGTEEEYVEQGRLARAR